MSLVMKRFDVHSHGGDRVLVTTRGLAVGQRFPVHLLASRSGNIERVRAGSLTGEACSMVSRSADCKLVQHAYSKMTDANFDPVDTRDATTTGRKESSFAKME